MDTRLKEWGRLRFIDPNKVLPELYKVQIEVIESDLSENVKGLRTNALKHHVEKRAAAIFCYGLSGILKRKIYFAEALSNSLDYDVVARYQENGMFNFTPIQLKEVVPSSVNPETNLNHEIEKLKKYTDSKETVVVIQNNRRGAFRVEDVRVPQLNIAGLWVFGASAEDQSKWFIAGDFMVKKPFMCEFLYPTSIK